MKLADMALVAKAVEELQVAMTNVAYGEQTFTATLTSEEGRALLAWIAEHDK